MPARVASIVAHLGALSWYVGAFCPELRYRWFGVIKSFSPYGENRIFSCKLKMSKNG